MVPLDRDLGVRLKVTSARQQTTAYRLKVYGVSRQVRQVTLRLEPGGAYSLAVRLPRSAVARSISASVVMLGGHWTPRQVRLQLPAA
jgi:predicted anti-sigma-YlaC factor YlaD